MRFRARPPQYHTHATWVFVVVQVGLVMVVVYTASTLKLSALLVLIHLSIEADQIPHTSVHLLRCYYG
jgi:hypothetical protein